MQLMVHPSHESLRDWIQDMATKVVAASEQSRPLGPYLLKEPPVAAVCLQFEGRTHSAVVAINLTVGTIAEGACLASGHFLSRSCRELFAGSAVMTAMWRAAGLLCEPPYDRQQDPSQDITTDS